MQEITMMGVQVEVLDIPVQPPDVAGGKVLLIGDNASGTVIKVPMDQELSEIIAAKLQGNGGVQIVLPTPGDIAAVKGRLDNAGNN